MNIEKLNSTVSVQSALGQGTTVEIRLPLTLTIVRALLVKLSQHTFAIPLHSVMESLERSDSEIFTAHRREVIRVRDEVLPLVRLRTCFGVDHAAATETHNGNGASTDGATSDGDLANAAPRAAANNAYVFTIPVFADNRWTSAQIELFRRESGRSIDPDDFRVAIALKLPNLGEVRVMLAVRHGAVSCGFSCRPSISLAALERAQSDLSEALREAGLRQVC